MTSWQTMNEFTLSMRQWPTVCTTGSATLSKSAAVFIWQYVNRIQRQEQESKQKWKLLVKN